MVLDRTFDKNKLIIKKMIELQQINTLMLNLENSKQIKTKKNEKTKLFLFYTLFFNVLIKYSKNLQQFV
jgi:hypothetical protein